MRFVRLVRSFTAPMGAARVVLIAAMALGAVGCGDHASSRASADRRFAGGFVSDDPDRDRIIGAQLDSAAGIVAGNPTAPVTVYEFADFQCPGCRAAATLFTPVFRKRYVETGRVRFVFIDFPLTQIHANAFAAARAGRCAAAAGKFEAYHDTLYAMQPQWARLDSAAAERAFAAYAVGLDLDRTAFQRCLASGQYDETIRANMKLGTMVGVRGTPTFFVGPHMVEAGSGQAIIDAVETALAAAGR